MPLLFVNSMPRFMAKQLKTVVASIEYRKAPEVKFSEPAQDAIRRYKA